MTIITHTHKSNMFFWAWGRSRDPFYYINPSSTKDSKSLEPIPLTYLGPRSYRSQEEIRGVICETKLKSNAAEEGKWYNVSE